MPSGKSRVQCPVGAVFTRPIPVSGFYARTVNSRKTARINRYSESYPVFQFHDRRFFRIRGRHTGHFTGSPHTFCADMSLWRKKQTAAGSRSGQCGVIQLCCFMRIPKRYVWITAVLQPGQRLFSRKRHPASDYTGYRATDPVRSGSSRTGKTPRSGPW